MGFRFANVSQILVMFSVFGRWASEDRRFCCGFCGCGMLQNHDGTHGLSQAMRERNLPVSCHMSSLLSLVKEF